MAPKDDLEFYGAGPKNKTPISTLRPRREVNYSESRSTSRRSSTVISGSFSNSEVQTPTRPSRKKSNRSVQKKGSPIENPQSSSPLSSIVEVEVPKTPQLRPRTRSQKPQSPRNFTTPKAKMGPIKENCEFIYYLVPFLADILW